VKPHQSRRTFISYSRVNQELALKLATELRETNFSIWIDQLDIPSGARWDNEVEKALNECGIFLIILTPESIASENVKDEIGFAIDHGKRLLPILLEPCDIPLRLRRLQYADFTQMRYRDGVERVKQLLEELIQQESRSSSNTISERTISQEPISQLPKDKRVSKPSGGSMTTKPTKRRPAASSHGDVITVSNQGSGNAIAAGHGAQASISRSDESGDMGAWRTRMETRIDQIKDLLPEDKADLKDKVGKIAAEISKGEGADAGRIERLLNTLGSMSSDIFEVAAATLVNPLAGIGLVLKKIGDRAKLSSS
jgi:hypothetical protein